ncbi:MAG: M23 family metallopeptidase [Candidatus Cloacimonetes bacterium]|nr:M23 family metallopeptidase [Candidatus Cloacimonadota bacterium]
MNKTFLLLAIIFLISVVLFHNRNAKLVKTIHQKDLKISASNEYINKLKMQLKESSKYFVIEQEKEEKLKKLLVDYLEEQGNKNVNSKDIEQNIQEFANKKKIIPDLVPLKGDYEISQKFSDSHQGLDFAASLGNEVVSSAYGEVISVSIHKYFGNLIEIDHFNGYYTRYAHLSKALVVEGQLVKKGNSIGLVGDTGNSTSPHLHFEILLNSKSINPLEILDI